MNNNQLKSVKIEFNFNQHLESTISKVLKVLECMCNAIHLNLKIHDDLYYYTTHYIVR